MPKKKKSSAKKSSSPAWHTSRIDNHPMLTVVFVLACVVAVVIALMAFEQNQVTTPSSMGGNPTPSVSAKY